MISYTIYTISVVCLILLFIILNDIHLSLFGDDSYEVLKIFKNVQIHISHDKWYYDDRYEKCLFEVENYPNLTKCVYEERHAEIKCLNECYTPYQIVYPLYNDTYVYLLDQKVGLGIHECTWDSVSKPKYHIREKCHHFLEYGMNAITNILHITAIVCMGILLY